jgi:hypothetical protein
MAAGQHRPCVTPQRLALPIPVDESPSHKQYQFRITAYRPELQRKKLNRESQTLHFAV